MSAISLKTTLTIRGESYTFTADPFWPEEVFVNATGGRASVYKLRHKTKGTFFALKVFKPEFQNSYTKESFTFIQQQLLDIPGLSWVKDRVFICREDDSELFKNKENVYLNHAILMPWFDFPKLAEVRENIRQKRITISTDQQFEIAQNFFQSVGLLEQRGFAHGDIAASNVLLDLDKRTVVIIDIEDMYHNSLQQPPLVFETGSGTAGYRFSSTYSSWDPHADRFATAIFLAELLSINNPQILQISGVDTYLSQIDIESRNLTPAPAKITALMGAMKSFDSSAAQILHRAFEATELAKVPEIRAWDAVFQTLIVIPPPPPPVVPEIETVAETALTVRPTAYQRPANSEHPTLLVFLLDLSRSMFTYNTRQTQDDSAPKRIKVAADIIGKVIRGLTQRSIVSGNMISPRYHIAVVGYHTRSASMLRFDRLLPTSTGDAMHDDLIKHGIAPLSYWPLISESFAQFTTDNKTISMGPNNNEGETHTTQALEHVYRLLNKTIHHYQDSHPPYVMHITDGANNDDKDPTVPFQKLTSLSTKYGNVLLSSVYIGADGDMAGATGSAIKTRWAGVNDGTEFVGTREKWANYLRTISSRMPAQYRSTLRAAGYSGIEEGAYMFFAGSDPEMIELAINNAMATGK